MSILDLIVMPILIDLMRGAAFVLGVVIFVHFACMCARIDGAHVPLLDALLIPCAAASGVGLAYTAATAGVADLAPALLLACAALCVFVLRVWNLGLHVSCKFTKKGCKTCKSHKRT